MTKLTAVTATSMMFIGSRSCCAATAHTDGGCSPLDRVRAVAREPLGRLAGGQARCRVGPQSRDDVGAVLGVRRRPRRVISPGERVVRGHVRREDSLAVGSPSTPRRRSDWRRRSFHDGNGGRSGTTSARLRRRSAPSRSSASRRATTVPALPGRRRDGEGPPRAPRRQGPAGRRRRRARAVGAGRQAPLPGVARRCRRRARQAAGGRAAARPRRPTRRGARSTRSCRRSTSCAPSWRTSGAPTTWSTAAWPRSARSGPTTAPRARSRSSPRTPRA